MVNDSHHLWAVVSHYLSYSSWFSCQARIKPKRLWNWQGTISVAIYHSLVEAPRLINQGLLIWGWYYPLVDRQKKGKLSGKMEMEWGENWGYFMIYPLIICYIANWKDPAFWMGQLNYFDWAIFNSYVKLPACTWCVGSDSVDCQTKPNYHFR